MIRPANRVAMLAFLPHGGVVAEIGVGRGAFAQQLLTQLRPARLHLIDPWQRAIAWPVIGLRTGADSLATVHEMFAEPIAAGIVQLHVAPSPAALDSIEPCDVIYIDGDHRYEAVAADLEAARRSVKPGGWICGHDYCDIFDRGVPRAVDEFCERHGLRIGMLTDEPPQPVINRSGINADLPDELAYNSFAIRVPEAA